MSQPACWKCNGIGELGSIHAECPVCSGHGIPPCAGTLEGRTGATVACTRLADRLVDGTPLCDRCAGKREAGA